MSLLARFRSTGQRPTLTDKVLTCASLDELTALTAACGARGQELTDAELAAIALRRAELEKAVGQPRAGIS